MHHFYIVDEEEEDSAEDEVVEEEDRVISDPDSGDEEDEELITNVRIIDNATQQFVSKNGIEVWQKQPFPAQRQHRRHDILRESREPTRQSVDAGCGENPAAAFRVFFNRDVMNIILRSTNEEGRRVAGDEWEEITMDEFYVF